MYESYLNTAIQSVETSGQILTAYFEKLNDLRIKSRNYRDVVTEVDILSENNIKKIIKSQYPDHSIECEESDNQQKDPDYCWHIDPLDGTVNYSQGITFCAVSVALEVKNQGIACAIFNPFSEELFFASKNNGAFLNGRRIRVSQKENFEEGLFVAAFSSAASQEKKKEYEIFGEINDCSRGALRTGSAALSLAYLSCGRIDGFWGKSLKRWDIAAGILLVDEAGGLVRSLPDKAFDSEQKTIVASIPSLQADLQEKLKPLAQPH